MMWQAIGVVVLGASSIVAAEGFGPPAGQEMPGNGGQFAGPPGFESGLMPGEQPVFAGDYAAANGGDCGCGPCGWFGRPCFFDSYFDYTGGRSPTNYSAACGYGPDWCYTWQARTEWLLWFSSTRRAPALATTSPAGTARADAGVLDDPDTSRLFSDDEIGENMRNGARVTIGRMLADNMTGLTGRFWGIENGAERLRVTSADTPIIARPFFNVTTLQEDAFLVSFPGVAVLGQLDVVSRNSLFGADAWLSRNIIHNPCVTLDLLAGYQFTRMDDSIDISSNATSIDAGSGLPLGTQIAVRDSFRTQNEFHGGTLGFLADFRKDVISLEVLGKLALGTVRQAIIIDGQTTFSPPGAPADTNADGLLAQNSNSGRSERNEFLVVPELNVNFIWHFTPQWKAIAGYSVIYWDSAVLAGDQIGTAVNLTQATGPLVGPAFPRSEFNRTDFLVQGMNLGLDYRW